MLAHGVDTFSAFGAVSLQALVSIVIYSGVADHDSGTGDTSLPQILFVAGLLRISWGIVETMSESLWETGHLAKSGELTYFMLSPIPTLVHLIFSKIHFERLADVVWGIGFIAVAVAADPFLVGDDWLLALLCCVLTVLLSMAVFFSVILFGAAANILWLSESGFLMSASAQVAELGLYPGRLFSKMLGPLAILFIPVFTPSVIGERLLFGNGMADGLPDWMYWGAIAVPAGCFAGACLFWRHTLLCYDGTGS